MCVWEGGGVHGVGMCKTFMATFREINLTLVYFPPASIWPYVEAVLENHLRTSSRIKEIMTSDLKVYSVAVFLTCNEDNCACILVGEVGCHSIWSIVVVNILLLIAPPVHGNLWHLR